MRRAGSQELVDSVDSMLAALGPHLAGDWQVSAGSLEWSCHATAAHVAHVLTKYATPPAGRHTDRSLPIDLVPRPGATPADLLDMADACGRLLAAVLDRDDPADRGWHWGMADPEGFA